MLIGTKAQIFDADWHGTDGNPAKVAGVKIGCHVWVCASALILKGVTVGGHSVVAAGAVVPKSVEPYSVVAGNPAKKVRSTSGFTFQ